MADVKCKARNGYVELDDRGEVTALPCGSETDLIASRHKLLARGVPGWAADQLTRRAHSLAATSTPKNGGGH